MALKLKWVSNNPVSSLLFKAFVAALLLAVLPKLSPWLAVIFIIGVVLLYFFPATNSLAYIVSAFTVIGLGAFFSFFFSWPHSIGAAIFFALIFWGILSLKSTIFVHRVRYYIFIRLILIYFLIAFILLASGGWLFKAIFLAFILWVLEREFFFHSFDTTQLADARIKALINFLPAVLALIVLELLWALLLLPLGFIEVISITFLAVYVFENILLLIAKEKLSYRSIIQYAAPCLGLTILILLLSNL